MKSEDLDQMLCDTLSGSAPADVHAAAQRHFDDIRARLQQPPAAPAAPSAPPRHPLWWLWPGMSLAGAAAVAILMFTLFFSPSVSWAQVVERFRALPFFNVTMYVSTDPSRPAEKLEMWASQDHRTRVHYRGLILFGEGGKVVKVLRANGGEEVSVETLKAMGREEEGRNNYPLVDMALALPERLGKMPRFSLDELLGTFGSNRQGLRPVPNLDASIAPDMQVFDVATPGFPDWLRLWVLKKSELPIRMRSWNPNDGQQLEAVFDYITQMPDEAFEPAKVQAAIGGKRGTANQLYALLKDPGKRPLTPGDVFASSGYHVPEIESAGRTEDGVLWVMSRHSWNRRPDGQLHYGWGAIADDLGQKYLLVPVGTADFQEERTLEYYIPLGYRTDYRKPASYTLTSTDQEDYRPQGQPAIIIGSVDVKEWKEGAPVPKLAGHTPAANATDFIRLALRHIHDQEDWDRFDQLAATIPGAPEESEPALLRDVLLAQKLDRIRQPAQAAALRARLFPLVKTIDKKKSWEHIDIIAAYLNDLLHAGQSDTARRLANECVAGLLQQDMPHGVSTIVFALHRGGMNEAGIRQFFDQDVLNLPKVKEQVRLGNWFADENSGDASKDPQFAAWRDFVAGLAARYASQPLPTGFDFIDEVPSLAGGQNTTTLPLPGHDEYRVAYFVTPTDPSEVAAHAASAYHIDASQVTVPKSVLNAMRPIVCVFRNDADWSQIWTLYLLNHRIDLVEKTAPRQVLVAHYDGRKLPIPKGVALSDGSALGLKLIMRSGGTSRMPNYVLETYEEAINPGIPFADPRRILVVDETGLSQVPRANQSYPDSYLAYECAFWGGPGAEDLNRQWFRDNFGITFQEEVRDLKVLELHTAR